HPDELVVDDLDDHLSGGERTQDLLADGFLADALDEVPDDGDGDVRLEEREADLLDAFFDVGLGQLSLATQARECIIQPLRKTLEHAGRLLRREGRYGAAQLGRLAVE